jgi:hypothetical protein
MDPERLPAGYVCLSDPHRWEEDATWLIYSYIRQGQMGRIPEAERLQFLQITDDVEERSYRTERHPLSTLRYPPESRLFVAWMLSAEPTDMVVRREIIDQLPLLTDLDESTVTFTEEFYEELCVWVDGEIIMLELVEATNEYESYGPVQVRERIAVSFGH